MIYPLNTIIQGDCIEVLKQLDSNSIDFCFADPPYFMQIEEGKKLYRTNGSEFNGCSDAWDKFPSMDAYKAWTREYLTEIRRVLKPNGSICIISGMQSIYEIGNIIRELGFWVINDIIWLKSNPTPNFSGSRLNNSHETLIWACKSKNSHFTFNYKTGKFLNGGKQMGSVWTFPVCQGSERLKDEEGNKLHSTQKPEALMHRIVVLFTKLGDLVLDPFGGTMTTAAICKRTGRNFITIERDEKYIEFGKKRIDSERPKIGDIERGVFDVKPSKVSFAEMVEEGYFKLGEKFYLISDKTKFAELKDKTGKLLYEGKIESMHDVAAKMLGRTRRVNAFDYLCVKRDGYVGLDNIRAKYREKKK